MERFEAGLVGGGKELEENGFGVWSMEKAEALLGSRGDAYNRIAAWGSAASIFDGEGVKPGWGVGRWEMTL